MKRLIAMTLATGIALCLATATASAQVIGAKVGMTWSKLDVKNDPDDTEQSRLSSFGGGGFLRLGLGGLTLQPEVLVITKGSKVDAGTEGTVKLKLDYLEIPVMVRFGLGSNAAFSPFFMVGPAFGFEIGCKAELEFDGGDVSGDCEDEGVDSLERKKFDIGAAGALGFEFKAGPGNILVEGRYTHGLTNLNDSDDDTEIRNRSFGLFAGYVISLGSR